MPPVERMLRRRGTVEPDLGVAGQHRTVSRVMRILELVADSAEPVRLTGLAEALGAPKTSVHGLVKGLVATGYLRGGAAGYVIGPAVPTLLGAVDSLVTDAARPYLEKLRAAFDETVILSAQVGSSVVYVDMVESTQFIRYIAPLRQRRPIYPTSTGKCFLANLPEAQRDAILSDLVAAPEQVRAVRAELDTARREGVAYNRGETVPDVSAAASLVLPPGRTPVAVAVVGPTGRVEARLPEMALAVRKAALSIGERIR
jgi:DNA-binding IclR family transcriptional regulator